MSQKINLPVVSGDAGLYNYLKEVNQFQSLTQEEEFMLAKAYLEHHDIAAAHKLVTSHLKLVAKIALSYKNYGLPVMDLISEGNIGLMYAVKKYNPDLGFRLSTYAMWWIKANIQEYILKSWSLVKLGTTAAQKKLFFSLGKIKHKLSNTHSRQVVESDFPQIAKELNVTTQEVTEMSARMSGGDLSLNVSIGDDTGSPELIDYLPESRPSQEMALANRQDAAQRHQMLVQAMSLLNEREFAIINARKLREEPLTLDELSHQFNISKERVRQIENRAFEKIQSYVLQATNL